MEVPWGHVPSCGHLMSRVDSGEGNPLGTMDEKKVKWRANLYLILIMDSIYASIKL